MLGYLPDPPPPPGPRRRQTPKSFRTGFGTKIRTSHPPWRHLSTEEPSPKICISHCRCGNGPRMCRAGPHADPGPATGVHSRVLRQ